MFFVPLSLRNGKECAPCFFLYLSLVLFYFTVCLCARVSLVSVQNALKSTKSFPIWSYMCVCVDKYAIVTVLLYSLHHIRKIHLDLNRVFILEAWIITLFGFGCETTSFSFSHSNRLLCLGFSRLFFLGNFATIHHVRWKIMLGPFQYALKAAKKTEIPNDVSSSVLITKNK